MEKAPAKLKEVIEESVHLNSWDDFCEQSEVPVRGEYLDVHPDLLQMLE